MRGYTEITTQAELDAFVEEVDALWDSILKETHVLNSGFVNRTDPYLATSVGFHVQMIFQSQVVHHDIEIVLCGIEEFRFDCHCLEDGIRTWSVRETDKWPRLEIRIGNLVASRMFYRLRPKSDRAAILGEEVPHPDAPPATIIEPGWRMCQHCINAWQKDESIIFARCPKCGHVTELAEE